MSNTFVTHIIWYMTLGKRSVDPHCIYPQLFSTPVGNFDDIVSGAYICLHCDITLYLSRTLPTKTLSLTFVGMWQIGCCVEGVRGLLVALYKMSILSPPSTTPPVKHATNQDTNHCFVDIITWQDRHNWASFSMLNTLPLVDMGSLCWG